MSKTFSNKLLKYVNKNFETLKRITLIKNIKYC